jgi:DNA-binding response OmpR family regulator
MPEQPASLLVVDDNEMNRDALSRRLQRHGYSVVTASNGQQALEILAEKSFDLVLLDVTMPGLNGLDVLKVIRRMDTLTDLPVIMVTAKSQSADIVEALELGANDYVTKPLDIPVVLARLRTQLSLKRAVDQVNRMTRRNKELETAAAELVAANQHVKRDVEAAAAVQRVLLPATPLDVSGARFAWALEPCAELAGDQLNIVRLSDRRVALYVVDVGSQGVAAALLAGTLSQKLAHPSGSGAGSPVQVVERLNEHFPRASVTQQPVTLLYGLLDLEAGELCFVSAGHPGPVYLPGAGEATVLGTVGLPVGLGKTDWQEHVMRVRAGDRLFLCSDGVTGARTEEGEHFGTGRLLSALARGRANPLEDSLTSLVREVGEWSGPSRHDDLAVVAVEITSPAAVKQETGVKQT